MQFWWVIGQPKALHWQLKQVLGGPAFALARPQVVSQPPSVAIWVELGHRDVGAGGAVFQDEGDRGFRARSLQPDDGRTRPPGGKVSAVNCGLDGTLLAGV